MPEGHYDLGGQDVIVKGSEARLSSGALAGSILKMNEGLKNLIQFTGDTIEHMESNKFKSSDNIRYRRHKR